MKSRNWNGKAGMGMDALRNAFAESREAGMSGDQATPIPSALGGRTSHCETGEIDGATNKGRGLRTAD